MPTEILMPALSPTMEEGTLAKWHVREGDAVRTGDVIAEIETDKATMEVEAIDDGTLGQILVAEGTEHIPVNRPIALLLTDGEAVPAAARIRQRSGATSPRGSGQADPQASPERIKSRRRTWEKCRPKSRRRPRAHKRPLTSPRSRPRCHPAPRWSP